VIYNVIATPKFAKELKKLAKKFPSLKTEFSFLIDQLEKKPESGTPLGKNCFKIRLAIKSKGKGKSGGARIITKFVVIEETVFLLSIFDKSTKDNITDKELMNLLAQID
tara:strand:+ start:11687 stop:12013 length:327 start_codon:yes stop_codon:yes gene_type:complete